MKTINARNNVVCYTVSTNNLDKGTITCIHSPKIKVGEFMRNVQFIDVYGNNMGRDGWIEEILKTEYFDDVFIECDYENIA